MNTTAPVRPPLFRKVAVALTFSPTAEALLRAAAHEAQRYSATLTVIHAGTATAEAQQRMNELIAQAGPVVTPAVVWYEGKPADAILKACQRESIDLLVTGALKREDMLQYMVGTVARHLMRKSTCSMLVLVQPAFDVVRHVVVNAEDSPFVPEALALGCWLTAREPEAWLHIVREVKLMGLTLASADACTEEEYTQRQQDLLREEMEEVEKWLRSIAEKGKKINIKMVSGKSGFELSRFAKKKEADLLIVGAPARSFSLFDRLFPHDQEYLFADLPANLMIINPPAR